MRTGRKGQALVEFALALPILLLFVFGIIDLAWMFYVNLTMQHAVREGTRYAVTGRKDLGRDRREAMIQKIKNESMGLYDKNLHEPKDPRIAVISPDKVTFENYTGTSTTGDPGARDEVILVSLTYTCPLLTPVLKPLMSGGAYTFTVKSTMRNKPF